MRFHLCFSLTLPDSNVDHLNQKRERNSEINITFRDVIMQALQKQHKSDEYKKSNASTSIVGCLCMKSLILPANAIMIKMESTTATTIISMCLVSPIAVRMESKENMISSMMIWAMIDDTLVLLVTSGSSDSSPSIS